MTMNLSLVLKQNRANQISSTIGASGTIKLYNGTMPATPDTALSGNTLLSTLTGNSTFAGAAVTNGLNNLTGGTGGTSLTSTTTVSFSGGGGTGAAATVQVSGGAIAGYTITNPGSGYTSAPTATLSAGAGGGTPPSVPTAVLGVVLAANAITQDSSAAASGTPTFARISTSGGTAHVDVDVGAVGSSAAFQITPSTITAGAPVTCSSFVVEEA